MDQSTHSPIQGMIALLAILIGLGMAVQAVARANGDKLRRLEDLGGELRAMDDAISRLDTRIADESKSLTKVDGFYHAWIPEIQKCQNSDALISDMMVEAYALNLVPLKNEVQRAKTFEFRGHMGKRDLIEVSVAGRYDRLVRFLDRIRRHYPFLSVDQLSFTVSDANVTLSLEMSNCNLTIPQADLEELEALDGNGTRQWARSLEEESH